MPVIPPSGNWWSLPIGRHEKIWLTLVVILGVSMFVMMPVWHAFGAQNSPTETYRVSTDYYWGKVTAFNNGDPQYSEKVAAGIKPKAEDVYIGAMRYAWIPNTTVLEVGKSYRIHLSSRDVNHGFSIHQNGVPSQKANFQSVPGYEYVLTMTFDTPGTYDIVCQEYCGLGHHAMVGKFVVEGRR